MGEGSEAREEGKRRRGSGGEILTSSQTTEIPFPPITQSPAENNSKEILHNPYKFFCDIINFTCIFDLLSTNTGEKQETDAVSL